ncbi:MAG: TetR/AcrR family transcriptional regulator [Kofleriaceae bacterium]|nr:TetR/AcrR family transcriptional regulator [Kofleriaceae bacterium]
MVARAAQKLPIRDQVIEAATRLFAARGFDATPLQDIADEVGVTKQAVLHHFPSKEQIRRGVLDSILAHWRDELPRLLLSATASDERFDSVLDEVYRFFAASPERARFIVREALDRPAEAREMLRAIAPILRGIGGYIRTGLGERSDDIDPDAYVLHVMQMIIGAAAVAEVTTSVLDAGGQARYDRELARIAKASLFGRRRAAAEPAKKGRRS